MSASAASSLHCSSALWAFVVEPASLRVREHTLELPRWPAQRAGLRVALLSKPRELILDKGGVVLFAETPQLGVVGTCALMVSKDGWVELTKMGVLESARGLKVGEFLLAKTLERASSLGMDKLYLLTNTKCAPAIHLYEKQGFVHDAGIMRRFGARYARCDVAMSYRPEG